MILYIARRLALLAVTLLLTSLIIFLLTQALPGDVARLILGREASPERIAAFRTEFGLDAPLPQQYTTWLTNFVGGNWGRSFSAGNPPVRPLVLDRLSNSLILAGAALLLSLPISIGLGIWAALQEGKLADSIISLSTLAVVGLPEFVIGIVLVNLFAVQLAWLPATSLIKPDYNLGDWLRILALPAITASLVLIGYLARLTRAGVLSELRRPYVRTATLKGLPRRAVILKHVLRNALLPTITATAISIGWLIGGMVVIEAVYNYPGIGMELVRAVEQKNLPMLQAIAVIIVATFASANLLADLLYAALNPRIRLS